MIYLLDTDSLIFMIRGAKVSSPKTVKQKMRYSLSRRLVERCRSHQQRGNVVGLSAITVAELEFGAHNSGNYERERSSVQKILAPFETFGFDALHCAVSYGEIRKVLESAGVVIGAMDMLIAAHARALSATLVTNNIRHFSRVPRLICENWVGGE